MEEKVLTEKESLELISQMIQATKKNRSVSPGKEQLYWGYFTSILALTIYLLIEFTSSGIWSWGWLFMFVFWGLFSFIHRRENVVVTYIDKTIGQVWQVLGWMFVITFFVVAIFGAIYGREDFILMMPLSLLYCGLGVSITGIIVREPWMIYPPLLSFTVCFYMLQMLVIGHHATNLWNLLFGLSFVVTYVVPGHITNKKSKAKC